MMMKELKDRIFTLCVLRDFWKDPIFGELFAYIKHPTATGYCEFVSLLYEANGGDQRQRFRRVGQPFLKDRFLS